MEIIGSTGDYGRRLRAAVIGFGATGRGAVTALNAHGLHDVHILTRRVVTAVVAPIHSAQLSEQGQNDPGSYRLAIFFRIGATREAALGMMVYRNGPPTMPVAMISVTQKKKSGSSRMYPSASGSKASCHARNWSSVRYGAAVSPRKRAFP